MKDADSDHGMDLAGFLDGSVTVAEKRRIEEHLKSCSQCRETLMRYGENERMLGQLFIRDPDWLCPASEVLMDFVTETLSEKEQTFIAAHVLSCESCRGRLAVLREAAETEPGPHHRENGHPGRSGSGT